MKSVGTIFGIFMAFMFGFGQVKAQEKVVKQPVKSKEMTISERVVKKPIKFEELPSPVQKAYKERYGSYQVKEVYYVKEGGRETYRVTTIGQSHSLLEIDFDATGKVVREEKKAGGEKSTRSTE